MNKPNYLYGIIGLLAGIIIGYIGTDSINQTNRPTATADGPATTMALVAETEAAGVAVQSLAVKSTTLDDVFVHYAGRALRDALQAATPQDSPFMIRRG